MRNGMVERVKAGDSCIFTGCLARAGEATRSFKLLTMRKPSMPSLWLDVFIDLPSCIIQFASIHTQRMALGSFFIHQVCNCCDILDREICTRHCCILFQIQQSRIRQSAVPMSTTVRASCGRRATQSVRRCQPLERHIKTVPWRISPPGSFGLQHHFVAMVLDRPTRVCCVFRKSHVNIIDIKAVHHLRECNRETDRIACILCGCDYVRPHSIQNGPRHRCSVVISVVVERSSAHEEESYPNHKAQSIW